VQTTRKFHLMNGQKLARPSEQHP